MTRCVGSNTSGFRWYYDCVKCGFFELHATEARCKWKKMKFGQGGDCKNRDAQTAALMHLMRQARVELVRRWMGTAYVLHLPAGDYPAILLEDWWNI